MFNPVVECDPFVYVLAPCLFLLLVEFFEHHLKEL
jgi:hypothetical protein